MCDIFLIDLDMQFIVLISHHESIIEEILGDHAAREGNISAFKRGACKTYFGDFISQLFNIKDRVTHFTDVVC